MSKTKTKKGVGKNAKTPKKDKTKQPIVPEQKVEIKTQPTAEEKRDEKQPSVGILGKKHKRDFSTYLFQGERYNKGRLVLAIIKKYSEKKPTLAQLKDAFPDKVIRPYSYGLFNIVATAKRVSEESGRDRFFLKDPVKLKDATICVSNQLTKELLDRFLEVAKKHKYVVK